MDESIRHAVQQLRLLLKAPDDDVIDLLDKANIDLAPKTGPAAVAYWAGYLLGLAEANDVTPSEMIENELGASSESFLSQNSKAVTDLIFAMNAAVKRSGAKAFGLVDVREALESWFQGGEPPQTPKQLAARSYLMSRKGQAAMKFLTDGLKAELQQKHGKVGFRDIGQAFLSYLA